MEIIGEIIFTPIIPILKNLNEPIRKKAWKF